MPFVTFAEVLATKLFVTHNHVFIMTCYYAQTYYPSTITFTLFTKYIITCKHLNLHVLTEKSQSKCESL